MYEPQRLRDIALALSPDKQTTFGTALADVNIDKRPPRQGAELARIARTFHSDIDDFNRGSEFASKLEEKSRQISLATAFDLNTLMAAIIAGFGMGKVVTTQPDVINDPNGYQHVFTFSTPSVSKIVPVTTIGQESTDDLKTKLVDMACGDFTISGRSGADAGPLSLAANWLGSGREAAGIASMPAVIAVQQLHNRDLDILIGTEGSPVSIQERIVEWSLNVTQNLVVQYQPGSGLFAGAIFHGDRRVTFSLGVHAKDVDDIKTLFDGTDPKEVQVKVEGPITTGGVAVKHTLDVRLPATRITGLEEGNENNFMLWRIEIGAEGIFKGSTLTEPLQITVINEEPTHLVAA